MRALTLGLGLFAALLALPASAQTAAPATKSAADAPTASAVVSAATPVAAAPRPGVDYEEMPIPLTPYANRPGKIEVAEVFSYGCIHCAHFQPYVDKWKATQPKDVDFEYVPAVFGGIWDNLARAYFAAEQLDLLEKTHDQVFKAIHEDRMLPSGSLEDIADLYGKLGANRDKFLAAMNAGGMDARLDRARQFALRTGVTGTPTVIVAGKYRLQVTRDRGPDGMLATIDALVARERAALASAKAKPAAAKP